MSNGQHNKVSVLDVDNRHISYTNPAKARILVRDGRATVFNANPFIIKLNGEKRTDEMKRFRKAIKSFTDYFKEERDVYVQNLSNTQISLGFGVAPNNSSALIPETRKPYNLSQYVPFKDLKNSVDLRKMLNRKPATLILLEEEEYNQFYEDLAAKKGTTADEEIIQANEEQQALMNRSSYVEREKKASKDADEAVEEEIKEGQAPDQELPEMPQPRIIGMCADDKLTATDFLERLSMMDDAGDLSDADFEYLQSNAPKKSVKNWAVKQLQSSD